MEHINNWAVEELKGADLGNKRLKTRYISLLDSLDTLRKFKKLRFSMFFDVNHKMLTIKKVNLILSILKYIIKKAK